MTRFTLCLLAALMISCSQAPAYAGDAPIPPVRVRIVCTVPTPWDPQACWVEFGPNLSGQIVQVASQTDAEELVAILLANGGRRYAFDTDAPPMAPPLPPEISPRLTP